LAKWYATDVPWMPPPTTTIFMADTVGVAKGAATTAKSSSRRSTGVTPEEWLERRVSVGRSLLLATRGRWRMLFVSRNNSFDGVVADPCLIHVMPDVHKRFLVCFGFDTANPHATVFHQ
jgi:hypothetical protein